MHNKLLVLDGFWPFLFCKRPVESNSFLSGIVAVFPQHQNASLDLYLGNTLFEDLLEGSTARFVGSILQDGQFVLFAVSIPSDGRPFGLMGGTTRITNQSVGLVFPAMRSPPGCEKSSVSIVVKNCARHDRSTQSALGKAVHAINSADLATEIRQNRQERHQKHNEFRVQDTLVVVTIAARRQQVPWNVSPERPTSSLCNRSASNLAVMDKGLWLPK